MDIKYIKVGKWYNVPFKVVEIKSGDIHMENGGIKAVCQPSELSEITTRQDVRTEHSTVGTLNSVERWEKLWYGMRDVLFGNVTKNTETAPKYDPNRMFREGDKVRIKREINGRLLHHSFVNFKYDTVYTVDADEVQKASKSGHVVITDGKHYCALSFYELELITPVEELEPYIVVDAHTHWDVADKNMKTVAMYSKGNHPHAKEAAEAERDRLNEQYRKEMENGQNG